MLPTRSRDDVGKGKGCKGKLCCGLLLISALRVQLWCLTKTTTEFPFAEIISDFLCGAQGWGPQGRHRFPLSLYRDPTLCLMNAGFTHGCLPPVCLTMLGPAQEMQLVSCWQLGSTSFTEELSSFPCLSLQHQLLGLVWEGSHPWIKVFV